jgi:DNA-directed RNA polymerase specialized sigma subunit
MVCKGKCPPLTWINGDVPLKEKIAKPDALQSIPQSSYNESISELMEDRQTRDIDRLDAIRECADTRRRMILGMLLVNCTQGQIADMMRISQTRVSRIAQGK